MKKLAIKNKYIVKGVISKELDQLLSVLSGNKKKVEEIVTTFINETPEIFSQIETSVKNQQWVEATQLVHKVKPRYGYFNLDQVMNELTKLEGDLSSKNKVDYSSKLKYLNNLNSEIINELKETRYFNSIDSEESTPLPLSGKLVLIAEDDEINAMVFDLLIKETGAATIIATDGSEAIKLAIEKSPDMIFMDVHMPFFSGLEAIHYLRGRGLKCPIVSLSASTRLDERQNSLDAGANDFLIKPANRESIRNALLTYLR